MIGQVGWERLGVEEAGEGGLILKRGGSLEARTRPDQRMDCQSCRVPISPRSLPSGGLIPDFTRAWAHSLLLLTREILEKPLWQFPWVPSWPLTSPLLSRSSRFGQTHLQSHPSASVEWQGHYKEGESGGGGQDKMGFTALSTQHNHSHPGHDSQTSILSSH